MSPDIDQDHIQEFVPRPQVAGAAACYHIESRKDLPTMSEQQSPASSTVVACPSCAALNRVPTARLMQGGKCGRCGNALFMKAPVTLTEENFGAHAARSDIPLLVDFWAAWCGPCRQMAPAFAEAATRLEPSIRLGKLDTETQSAIAGRYGIRSIPTLILFSKGREIARQSGAMSASAIVNWVKQASPATSS